VTAFVFLARAVVVLALSSAIAWCLLSTYRRSRVMGMIVALSVVVRVSLGVALFAISYLHLPVATSLQIDGGFWVIALDAIGYFQMASARALHAVALFPIDSTIPSPFFVQVLALWMILVGTAPIAATFLNVCLYVALVTLIIKAFDPVDEWHVDLPCVVGVTAYSFSPLMLFDSTQPLKDEMSAFFVGMACLGVLKLKPLFTSLRTKRDWAMVGSGSIGLTVAAFGLSGIRWYFSFIMWCALVIAFFVAAAITIGAHGFRRDFAVRAVIGVLVLALTFAGFGAGSGPFYSDVIGANLDQLFGRTDTTMDVFHRVQAIPSSLITWVQVARTGFLRSGGGTNVVVSLRADPTAGFKREDTLTAEQHASAAYQERIAAQPRQDPSAADARFPNMPPVTTTDVKAARAIPLTAADHFRTVATGLGLMLLPISIFERLTGIVVPGGRGLLFFADLDTAFMDIMTIVVIGLLWSRRKNIDDRILMVIFDVVLAASTAVLVGYVVTNFGTLWRLRSLAIVPLWFAAIGLSPRAPSARSSQQASPPMSAAS
jgi:hypothetical protein